MSAEKYVRPSELPLPPTIPLYKFAQSIYPDLVLSLHADDAMYWGNATHYLSAGASAIDIINGVQSIASVPDFKSILDFGSGAGRVTRWLRAAYPQSIITAADIRAEDLDFVAATFKALTWNPGIDFTDMEPPGQYDLIWAGSVLTHLSISNTRLLLEKVMQWSNVGGIAVLSFHGRSAYSWRRKLKYIDHDLLPPIEEQYEATGFGYSNYRGQSSYGISFCTPAWMVAQTATIENCRVISISERVWDNHHDIIALQRMS
jgi:hypothetical protein